MRPKVAIFILLFGATGLCLVWQLRPRTDVDAASQRPPAMLPVTVSASTSKSIGAKKEAKDSDSATAALQPDATAKESQEEKVIERIAQLMDLAMTDEASSLTTILAGLNDPDPRIREAAVTATVQFKSPEAIPALREACAHAVDPEEKVQIQKAIEFLTVSPVAAGDG